MSERLGMADGRCFTVGSASTLFNDYMMKSNNIMPQDNYSYRKLLQQKGPALLQPITNKKDCEMCHDPLLKIPDTY